MNKEQRLAYVLAILAVFFWSTVPTAFKLGLRYQDNYQLLSGAAIVSLLFLGITLIIQGKISLLRKLKRKHILYAAALALLNPFSKSISGVNTRVPFSLRASIFLLKAD